MPNSPTLEVLALRISTLEAQAIRAEERQEVTNDRVENALLKLTEHNTVIQHFAEEVANLAKAVTAVNRSHIALLVAVVAALVATILK